jgi:hypothetical protein
MKDKSKFVSNFIASYFGVKKTESPTDDKFFTGCSKQEPIPTKKEPIPTYKVV